MHYQSLFSPECHRFPNPRPAGYGKAGLAYLIASIPVPAGSCPHFHGFLRCGAPALWIWLETDA